MTKPRPSQTRMTTLYRLLNIEPTRDAMFDALEDRFDRLDRPGIRIDTGTVAGCPAVIVHGSIEGPPGWMNEAAMTTGLLFDFFDRRSFVLLLLAVDAHVYALGYSDGHHYIPSRHTDKRFGLALAARLADTEQVRGLSRRRPDQRGRVDATSSAEGIPFWTIPVDQHSDLVFRLGAGVKEPALTASRDGKRRVLVDGGIGLRARYGVRPEDLVRDIRELAAHLETRKPVSTLAFIEHIMAVRDSQTLGRLDARLDEMLASADTEGEIALSVPDECLDDFDRVRCADVKVGPGKPTRVDEVTAEAIVQEASELPSGERVQALRDGRVRLYADEGRTERLTQASTIRWIEAAISEGRHRYHLMDGTWLEIDAVYADSQDEFIEGLLGKPGGIELPPWEHGLTEGNYLEKMEGGSMPVLDQKWIRLRNGRRLEACDLLGPGNELVHVKQADSSKPLSHLFNQGLVSAKELDRSAKVREQFAKLVEKHGNGRMLPYGFRPQKVVFAFRRANGKPLSVKTLFPFAKIALAETAKQLQDMGIDVQIVFIDTVPV